MAGWFTSVGSDLGLQMAVFSLYPDMVFPLYVSLQISSPYIRIPVILERVYPKDLTNLSYPFRGPISKCMFHGTRASIYEFQPITVTI